MQGPAARADSDGLLRRSSAGNPGVMAAALPAGARIRFKILRWRRFGTRSLSEVASQAPGSEEMTS